MQASAGHSAAFVAATLFLSACATPGTQLSGEAEALRAAGTDQTQAAAIAGSILQKRSLAELLQLAKDGDRVAAFLLGHHFEYGYENGGDLRAALEWYTLAATPIRSQQSFYQPPVGGQSYSSIVSVPTSKLVVAAAPASRDRVAMLLGEQGVE